MHLIKVRNNNDDKTMIFMKMEGQNQRMVEVATPTATRPQGIRPRLSQRGEGNSQPQCPIGKEI